MGLLLLRVTATKSMIVLKSNKGALNSKEGGGPIQDPFHTPLSGAGRFSPAPTPEPTNKKHAN